MYKIISGKTEHYVDNIVFIRLNPESGCYVICDEKEADGICTKVPKQIIVENETINTCEDTVFAIKDSGLHGTEKVCVIEPAQIAMDYFNTKMSAELLQYENEQLIEYKEALHELGVE